MYGTRRLPPAPLICAPMHRALAAVLTVAALLAVPAAAMAQSAGDEQYVDPFQGGEEQPSQAPEETPQAPPPEAPAQPAEPAPAAPAPAEPAAPAAPSGEAGEVTTAPTQTAAPTLPRTGFPVALLLPAGAALLLAGVALRRTI
jgi:pyruvate dehydrogenase E2 component (dihydrolipoamide acetyltransferase)